MKKRRNRWNKIEEEGLCKGRRSFSSIDPYKTETIPEHDELRSL
jgi:hypothetical protein